MTDAAIGLTTTFELGDLTTPTPVFTTIAEIFSLTPPNEQMDYVDATNFQSPNGYREFIAGLTDPGEMSFEMNFLPGSASEAAILAAKATRVKHPCRVTFPNSVVWEYDAIVGGYEPAVPVDDKMTATVTLRVTGSVVHNAAAAPVNEILPAISGIAQDGEVLTALPGQWSGAPTFTYQWKLDGSDITGETGSTYTVVTGDIGSVITVVVTATNSEGSDDATSAGTADVIA